MGGGYPGARAEKDVVARHCDKIRVFISSQEATHQLPCTLHRSINDSKAIGSLTLLLKLIHGGHVLKKFSLGVLSECQLSSAVQLLLWLLYGRDSRQIGRSLLIDCVTPSKNLMGWEILPSLISTLAPSVAEKVALSCTLPPSVDRCSYTPRSSWPGVPRTFLSAQIPSVPARHQEGCAQEDVSSFPCEGTSKSRISCETWGRGHP